MIANYHTHTARCRHADGKDRDYVEAAIKNGIKYLGFSDHAPYEKPDGFHRMRMLREEAEDYVKSVLSLREEYKGQIEIYLGFETEYFPKYYEDYKKFVSQFPIDYFILGQHFVPEESGKYIGVPFSEAEYLKLYVDLCIEGISTGDFTYIAHPDVVNFTGDKDVYLNEMSRLVTAMKEKNIPAEFNLLGFRDYRHYPTSEFFTLAKEASLPVIIGCDAHSPRHCGDKECAGRATELLKDMGITPIETIELIKPKF